MIGVLLGILGVVFCCYALSIVCDEFFVKSLDTISKKRKLSDDIAGATLMAIGTSAPEFFTSLMALLSGGKAGLGAGTIIGSAIFNILCIAGGSALFLNTVLKKGTFLRDAIFYGLFIGLIFRSFWDGQIVWMEATMYILLYICYILYLKRSHAKNKALHTAVDEVVEEMEEIENTLEKKFPLLKIIDAVIEYTYPAKKQLNTRYRLVFRISIGRIVFLSWVLVESGVVLAHSLGVSEVIIGLTVLAAGTSVPDLISSLIVAKQGRGDMAVSNALGSNIFDIGICLGIPWVVYLAMTGAPVPVSNGDLLISIGTLLGVLILVVGTLFVTRFRINKRVGYIFLGAYALYLVRAVRSAVTTV